MKRRRSDWVQLGVLLLLGLSVVLTLVMPDLAGLSSGRPLTEVSILLRESDTALWQNARLGMERAAADLGAEVRFLAPPRENDHDTQLALLLREVEGGADALVVVPADPMALEVALEEHRVSLPVVTMESALPGRGACVAPDDGAVGRALALACLEDSERGTVLLVDTAGKSAGVAARLADCAGVLEAAGRRVEIRTLPADQVAGALPTLLYETGAALAIAFEPAATLALVQGGEGLTHPPLIYGVGAVGSIPAQLERGTLTASAAWSDYAAGYLAVQAAVRAAGDQGPAQTEALPFTLVRGEDIYEKDIQKLLFPVIS